MTRFQKTAFWVIVALQVLALAGMAGARMHLLATGKTVVLACLPVDPRSLFSGDYVILNYEISRIPMNEVEQIGPEAGFFPRNQTIYVGLKRDLAGKYRVAAVSRDLDALKEKYPTVIRGTVTHGAGTLVVRYGIEQFFVPQHQGRKLEHQMKDITVEAALSPSGEAAIKRLLLNGKEVTFY